MLNLPFMLWLSKQMLTSPFLTANFCAGWPPFHLISVSWACHCFEIGDLPENFQNKKKKDQLLSIFFSSTFCVFLSLRWKLAFKILMFGKNIQREQRTIKILHTRTKKMKCEFGRIECDCLGAFQWDRAWLLNQQTNHAFFVSPHIQVFLSTWLRNQAAVLLITLGL